MQRFTRRGRLGGLPRTSTCICADICIPDMPRYDGRPMRSLLTSRREEYDRLAQWQLDHYPRDHASWNMLSSAGGVVRPSQISVSGKPRSQAPACSASYGSTKSMLPTNPCSYLQSNIFSSFTWFLCPSRSPLKDQSSWRKLPSLLSNH